MKKLLFILLFPFTLAAQVDYMNLPSGDVGTYDGNAAVIAEFGSTTISGKKFTNSNCGLSNGHGLWIKNCNGLTIEDNFFFNCCGRALVLDNCTNITVNRNLIANNERQIYAENCDGGIVITNNQALNVRGPFGQFVQFTFCSGAGNIIEDNVIDNYFGESTTEDIINIFSSQGTSGSPILIQSNIVRGGGPSASGGGLLGGDNGGEYITFNDNKLKNPGQYGINAAGGEFIAILNNLIWSDEFKWSSLGIVVMDFDAETCANITVGSSNKVNWVCGFTPDRCATVQVNNSYYDGSCTCSCSAPSSLTQGEINAFFPTNIIDLITEDEIWQLRADKTYQSNIVDVGEGATPPDPIDLNRPNANAGSDQSITISTATLSASGSSAVSTTFGTNTLAAYHWVQVSGPNTATMSSAVSSANNLSGLIDGTYVFRLEVTQNNVQFGYDTFDADWMNVVVALEGEPEPPTIGERLRVKFRFRETL